ncbi:MAG: RluA family pseudouridine synthase [Bacteroidia bacterium]|nr:RluA family pseudouridine synthase [Bacteroidia bacterium]
MKKASRSDKLDILYEDNHLIAVNKPNGILVQPDITRDTTLADKVKVYIKEKYNKPGAVFLGVIHRLDRPVSGVVLFARTSKALKRMNKAFRDRKVEKKYLALVKGPINLNGKLIDFLKKSEIENRSYVVKKKNVRGVKRCELNYEVIRKIDDYHMLEILPITGRSHQIRVQLSNHGFPIIGDLKYGGYKPSNSRQICLHCKSLSFDHPTLKEKIVIKAKLPKWKEWQRFE